MLKECIKEASTIDEAKQAIANELGVSMNQIEFEVLQEPQKKTLGLFGGNPAKVKGSYQASPAAKAIKYLEEILSGFNVSAFTVELVSEDEEGCRLSISGEDVGFIIGRRGDTLDSLQYLTGLIANKGVSNYYRVMVDINGYREKREDTLRGLAKKIAGEASRTGRKTSLEPMNPYERRIIHTAVQEINGAISWSVGVADRRHVVVGPSDDNPNKNRQSRSRKPSSSGGQGGGRSGGGNRGNNDGGQRRPRDNDRRPERDSKPSTTSRYDEDRPERPVRTFVPRTNPIHDVDGATPPSKTQSEKEESSTLYGRIDL